MQPLMCSLMFNGGAVWCGVVVCVCGVVRCVCVVWVWGVEWWCVCGVGRI